MDGQIINNDVRVRSHIVETYRGHTQESIQGLKCVPCCGARMSVSCSALTVFTQNQLTLWKYLSMVKMAELTGHTSRVLFMARSPDGCTVASAAGDGTLNFVMFLGLLKLLKLLRKLTRCLFLILIASAEESS
ncbi:hypothetical protein CRG98_038173 [Punica granatum]|uniref:Uncharacterized protein n=1 Tax=Punica granatum TaxID=22663 RepID=A0A2I0IBS0_PUNGR|nr:hypothetical protein CRG98_038173 [Punica granatum]